MSTLMMDGEIVTVDVVEWESENDAGKDEREETSPLNDDENGVDDEVDGKGDDEYEGGGDENDEGEKNTGSVDTRGPK